MFLFFSADFFSAQLVPRGCRFPIRSPIADEESEKLRREGVIRHTVYQPCALGSFPGCSRKGACKTSFWQDPPRNDPLFSGWASTGQAAEKLGPQAGNNAQNSKRLNFRVRARSMTKDGSYEQPILSSL